MSQVNSFGAKATLTVGGKSFEIYRLDALQKAGIPVQKLPFSLRVLLENLLRNEDGKNITKETILDLANWDSKAEPSHEIDFAPSRVILQDFTGVPAVVDLAAMRDAMKMLGGDPNKINPLQPVDLVIDHSVQVDEFGRPDALSLNSALEFSRNKERYGFLRWGGKSFERFRLVPPATGIVHQVNLEYLAQVVFPNEAKGQLYPDSVIGTDSHTTMINGLGVLGWGVGGIEAEAAMLGQPVSMLIPHVIGFRLTGALPAGTTATDMVLVVTEKLRKRGVVGKFVEFFGPGVANITVADRATIANMAPEYGATCGIFPIDNETIAFLQLTGRPDELCALVEAYYREQHMFGLEGVGEAVYTDVLELDLSTVRPSLAGPKRPQDRLDLANAKTEWQKALGVFKSATPPASKRGTPVLEHAAVDVSGLVDGSVVIAAITSCTNTSNPSVMMAAGLLAKKAHARGIGRKPWVKTSLAPGSKVVTDYLNAADCTGALDALGFYTVGYGCTTCIGNSGPLPAEVSAKIAAHDLTVVSVLSGNRNFEGRVHAEVRANYLASPPLVVAYAIAGTMDIDFAREPIAQDKDGKDVFLADLWPSAKEVSDAIAHAVRRDLFQKSYAFVFDGDERWRAIEPPKGDTFAWDDASTYVRHPPYFEGMTKDPKPFADITGARALAVLGDSITTDHISPAGNIKKDSPAGKYLLEKGVAQADFNQYGARRGNHEIMVRGTFANIRLRNALAGGIEGGVTKYLPTGEITTIFEASEKYRADGTPVIVLGGKEYGSGSSRDWAAKGPMLLGIRAVIAESFERIHRSNLVGMGILPLQFADGENVASLGLTGEESFTIEGVAQGLSTNFKEGKTIRVRAKREDGTEKQFSVLLRIDTPQERKYVQHGGILPFVLRQLALQNSAAPVSSGTSLPAEAPGHPASDGDVAERDANPPRAPLHPALELLLVGGLTPLLLAASWLVRRGFGLDPAEHAVGFTFFYAAFVINDPHFAVTYVLFYRDARSRLLGATTPLAARARYALAGFVLPLLLLIWASAALFTRSALALGYLLQLMFLLVGWHYVKQGFGLMLVLSARRGAFFTPRERMAVLVHCYAGWAYAWASPADAGTLVSEKGVVFTTIARSVPLERVTFAVFLASAAALVLAGKAWRERRRPHLTPLMALLCSVWAWSVYSSFDPLVRYMIPALHSVQYLYIVYLYRSGEAREREGPPHFERSVRASVGLLVVSSLGLGFLLFHAAPTLLDGMLGRPGRQDPVLGATPYFAALFAFVNLHHYFMDAVLWRRDNPLTRYLQRP